MKTILSAVAAIILAGLLWSNPAEARCWWTGYRWHCHHHYYHHWWYGRYYPYYRPYYYSYYRPYYYYRPYVCFPFWPFCA